MTSKEEKIMEGIKGQYERYLELYYNALAKNDSDGVVLWVNCMSAFERALILSKHITYYNRLVKAEREWDERYRLWSGTIDEEGKLREETENADTD